MVVLNRLLGAWGLQRVIKPLKLLRMRNRFTSFSLRMSGTVGKIVDRTADLTSVRLQGLALRRKEEENKNRKENGIGIG